MNTFYNAERAFEEGERLTGEASVDSLPAPAREAYEKAAEKSAIVLRRYDGSEYADDALHLMGRSFLRLGRYADAAAAFERLVARFPESEFTPRARLDVARAKRLAGDAAGAEAALGVLAETGEAGLEAELLHERALIALASGDHRTAVKRFATLLDRHPEYAHRAEVAVRFADAELALGEIDAALEAYTAYRERAANPAERREAGLKMARALTKADRTEEALDAYDALLEDGVPDSLAGVVLVERGEVLAAREAWDEAESAFQRAAEVAPGTPAASRATVGRGRIVWMVRDDREAALEILLDAFLHAPTSAWGDSARTAARHVAELLHYERLAGGREEVPAIDDPALVRSTALYRLGEEVLDVEEDPAAAAAIFERIVAEYPDSPWRPKALLSAGLLRRASGNVVEGDALLRRLVEVAPESPEADSARRALGVPVPERPEGFYDATPVLVTLAEALPGPQDPMARIADQLDRYATRRSAREEERPVEDVRRPPGEGGARGDEARSPDRAGDEGEPRLPEGAVP